jgi:Na+/proline symporter
MFTEDVFTFYGGTRRFGAAMQVATGRVFVVLLTLVAYAIAMTMPASIFSVATQYAFAGYAALAPLLVAALFWQRSTRWGALAATLWTATAVGVVALVQTVIPPPSAGATVVWAAFGMDVITRGAGGMLVMGLLPVVPMTLVSGLLLVVVSLATPAARPSRATLDRYFA